MVSRVQWWLLFTSHLGQRDAAVMETQKFLPLMTLPSGDIKHTTEAVSCCEKQMQRVLWNKSPGTALKMISASLDEWHGLLATSRKGDILSAAPLLSLSPGGNYCQVAGCHMTHSAATSHCSA